MVTKTKRANRATCYTALVDYEWDAEKAATNLDKHSVSFDEAATVFDDPLYIDFYDPAHSIEEHRYIIVGNVEPRSSIIGVLYRKQQRHSLDQCSRTYR